MVDISEDFKISTRYYRDARTLTIILNIYIYNMEYETLYYTSIITEQFKMCMFSDTVKVLIVFILM